MRKWFEIQQVMALSDGGGRSAEINILEQIGEDWWDGSGVTAKGFIESVQALGDISAITLNVSSLGGSYFDALAINNYLRSHPAQVTARVLGLAASAASIIVAAADHVCMPANSMLMVHDPKTYAYANAAEMRQCAADLDKISASMLATYCAKCGDKTSAEAMAALCKAETYLTAQEALDMGLCDQVEEPMQISASLEEQRGAAEALLASACAELEASAAAAQAALVAPVPAAPPPPSTPSAVAIVASCRQAGFEWFAAEAITAGISEELVSARLQDLRACRDIAVAAHVHPTEALLRAVSSDNHADILRHAIDCARGEGVEIISHLTTLSSQVDDGKPKINPQNIYDRVEKARKEALHVRH